MQWLSCSVCRQTQWTSDDPAPLGPSWYWTGRRPADVTQAVTEAQSRSHTLTHSWCGPRGTFCRLGKSFQWGLLHCLWCCEVPLPTAATPPRPAPGIKPAGLLLSPSAAIPWAPGPILMLAYWEVWYVSIWLVSLGPKPLQNQLLGHFFWCHTNFCYGQRVCVCVLNPVLCQPLR